jgi:hypothetical protein
MKKLIIISSVIFFLIGCAKNIHDNFSSNRYSSEFNTHVFNDSLELYFKSPADIKFVTENKELKQILKKNKSLESVLLYGITDEYEIFIIHSSNLQLSFPDYKIQFDTIIENKKIFFLGHSIIDNTENILTADLSNIFKSLVIGEKYTNHKISIFDIVNKHSKSNVYFKTISEIMEFPSYDESSNWNKLQMELTFSSYLGKNEYYDNAINKFEKDITLKPETLNIIDTKAITSNIISKIINDAKENKLIMINENHYFPNHRLFVLELLPKLKEIGYETIALEALSPKQDSLLNLNSGYPKLQTGFYTKEQNYSNLIRKAKELDFTFVGYENRDKTIDREVGQAENLYNKTFKKNPNKKVIVLLGIDHLLEKETPEGKEWMAKVFIDKYSINPLTISQTHLNHYRSEIKENYSLIEGKEFKNHILNSIDYILINNNSKNTMFNDFFHYKNNFEFDIQISLFCGNEVTTKKNSYGKIPYFTTIIKENGKLKIPFYSNNDVFMMIYDSNGKIIWSGIKTPPNKT